MTAVSRKDAKAVIERELKWMAHEEPVGGWGEEAFDTLSRKLSYLLDCEMFTGQLMDAYESLTHINNILNGREGWTNRAKTDGNALELLDAWEDVFSDQLRRMTYAWFNVESREVIAA